MSSFHAGVDHDFPDQVYASLQRSNHSKQISAQLNTSATMLAVGCSDGAIAMSVQQTTTRTTDDSRTTIRRG